MNLVNKTFDDSTTSLLNNSHRTSRAMRGREMGVISIKGRTCGEVVGQRSLKSFLGGGMWDLTHGGEPKGSPDRRKNLISKVELVYYECH